MQPHQQRVADEKIELDCKIEKLEAFFSNPIFDDLDEKGQELLREQALTMKEYSNILEKRINRFK